MAVDLELNPLGVAAVDDKVRAGDIARGRAGEKDDAVGNFLWTAKATGWHLCYGGSIEVRHAGFDGFPIPGGIFDRARRHCIDSDRFRRE